MIAFGAEIAEKEIKEQRKKKSHRVKPQRQGKFP